MRTDLIDMNWAWNHTPDNNPIPIRGHDLIKLLERVQQLEEQGYEHVKPYQKVRKNRKHYNYDMNGNFGKGRYSFIGHEEKIEYLFVMRKKAE